MRIGIVFIRGVGEPQTQSFFSELVLGLEDELVAHGGELVIQIVQSTAEELQTYERWKSSRMVDAVVLKDTADGDQRLDTLSSLGLPFVLLGDVSQRGDFSAVLVDNRSTSFACVEALAERGHGRIARVTGPPEFVHTARRTTGFFEAVARLDLQGKICVGDYSLHSGRDAVRELLDSATPPTAILFDSDTMALGALDYLDERVAAGAAPVDLIAWDDSLACQLADPAVSAFRHDVRTLGVELARVAARQQTEGANVSTIIEAPVLIMRRDALSRRGPTGAVLEDIDNHIRQTLGATEREGARW